MAANAILAAMLRCLCLSTTLALLAACGDPQSGAGSLRIADATIPAGSDRTLLEVELTGPATPPIMLQFDLCGDAEQLQFDEAVEALQELGTVRSHRLESGDLRVLIGDLSPTWPTKLPTGPVLRLPVRVLEGAGDGPFEVRIENIAASNANGRHPHFDPTPVTARITRSQ